MSLAPAPFRADLADTVSGARAWWVHASDGIRLRIAHFPGPAQASGTVLLFPGRTEYIEKYGRTAADLSARGYHVLVIDWRGQGLSERMLEEKRAGHVMFFEDYQRDVAEMQPVAGALALPRPFHLIAHSMGGCIGLRAAMDGLPVASCVFSGPMWGIRITMPVRPAAWALSWGGKRLGLGHLFTPGTRADNYVASMPFEGNTLTTDREMWDFVYLQLMAVPELQLGGPSLNWLNEALSECMALAKRPAPHLPCITYVGLNERIVDVSRIRSRMAGWSGGRLEVIPGGEHEILMENRAQRTRLADQMTTLFDQAGAGRADAALIA